LQDVIDKHGTEARQQLSRLVKILDHCRSLKPLEQEELPENLPGVVFVDRLGQPKGNARTIQLSAYDKPSILAEINWSYRARDNWWWPTSRALSNKPPPFSRQELKSNFELEYKQIVIGSWPFFKKVPMLQRKFFCI